MYQEEIKMCDNALLSLVEAVVESESATINEGCVRAAYAIGVMRGILTDKDKDETVDNN